MKQKIKKQLLKMLKDTSYEVIILISAHFVYLYFF